MLGNHGVPKELVAGIGDFHFMPAEAWAVSMSREGGREGQSQPCLEEVERMGYARDMCGFMRLFWGSMFLGQSPWGPFPRPDFILSQTHCTYQTKWMQVVREYLGLPLLGLDTAYHAGDGDLKSHSPSLDYLMGQMEDMIEWLQRVTGRPYDEEAMIKAVANQYRTRGLWAEIMQAQGNVPAPLEWKLILPFWLTVEIGSYRDEGVELIRELKDEVNYRVERGIAPLPEERCRAIHYGHAPWQAMHFFSYLRQRGVAIVGGPNQLHYISAVQLPRPDGAFQPEAPVDWASIPQTREQALRYLARGEVSTERFAIDVRGKIFFLQAAIKLWGIKAVIFSQDRGCKQWSQSLLEVKRAVQAMGVAAMAYECNRVDPRDWSWSQIADSVDAFLEAVGVPPLSD